MRLKAAKVTFLHWVLGLALDHRCCFVLKGAIYGGDGIGSVCPLAISLEVFQGMLGWYRTRGEEITMTLYIAL